MKQGRRALNSIHQGLDKDELLVLFQLMEKEDKDNELISKLQKNLRTTWPCDDEDLSDEDEGGAWSDFGKKGMESEEWGKFVGTFPAMKNFRIYYLLSSS